MLDNLNKYHILLCSTSPRRRELMKMLDIDFDIAPPIDVEENYPETLKACEVPLYLSALKARAYARLIKDNELIITADTVVICDNHVIGKPSDAADARRMLLSMQGREHIVVTGVSITTADRHEGFDVTTKVRFDRLGEDEIDYYISKYNPMDKAGAYGIQEWIGVAAVAGIEGSFYNVMGLPVHQLYTYLKDF